MAMKILPGMVDQDWHCTRPLVKVETMGSYGEYTAELTTLDFLGEDLPPFPD